jgi:hypothetical protein
MVQTTRRSVFGLLSAISLISAWIVRPRLKAGHEIVQSFDAREWAKDFVAHVKAHPGIPTDLETMTGWFANALMRGYDERSRDVAEDVQRSGQGYLRLLTVQSIRGCVARGWCSEKNQHKVMDCDLAEGITQELMALRNT